MTTVLWFAIAIIFAVLVFLWLRTKGVANLDPSLQYSRELVYIVVLLIIVGFAVILLSTLSPNLDNSASSAQGPAIYIVGATALLLAFLSLLALIYYSLNLTDVTQSLGLPQGSVRALIALLLLTTFVSLSLYLYQTMARGNETTLTIPQTAFANFAEQLAIQEIPFTITDITAAQGDNEATYTIRQSIPLNDGAGDMARQLLTILGTLVGTISGFYFGTRSLETAGRILGNQGTEEDIGIHAISPDRVGAGQSAQLTVTGRGFDAGATLELSGPSPVPQVSNINVLSKTTIQCDVAVPTGHPGGNYDLIIDLPSGTSAVKLKGFKVP
jgi:hypothetical protein